MFGPIIQRLVKTTIQNSINFELSVDPLIQKFKNQCPPRDEIDKILKQKNTISQALTQTQNSLLSITNTSNTLEQIISALNISIKVIKIIPIPSAVPPGIGIPINIIIGFSDVLNTLGKIVDKGEGVVKQIIPAVNIIIKSLNSINSKLNILDSLLMGCLEKETEGMTDIDKQSFYNNLGIDIKRNDVYPQNYTDPVNSYNYKGFILKVEEDSQNTFSFPRRRIIAFNKSGYKMYGPYSYSSSIQVLIDSMKFEIDIYLQNKI